MKKLTVFIVVILALGIGIFLVRKDRSSNISTSGLQKINVQAGWILNGEFAAVCSALVNGYYRNQGLDVKLIPGGPSGANFIVATTALAQDSSIDIAIDGDLVPFLHGTTKTNPSERFPIKVIGALWNKSPYGFIVRRDSGLTSIKDFSKRRPNGQKYIIGVTSDFVLQDALASYAGVKVSDLDFVTVGFDATPFLLGKVDALASYWTTQAYAVEKAGIAYNFLPISEIPGFDQPSQVIITRDDVIKNKEPQLVAWFKATKQGIDFVRKNPEKAAENILNNSCGGAGLNKDQELWLINKSLPLYTDGSFDTIQIENFANTFKQWGQIPFVPNLSDYLDPFIVNKSKN
ncbi:MAG: ABC transporter substrate-binding protein [Nanoarchaeota archaeon]|nr:ABC transporter substrate-binding protein [Nanoarchaeota archaeon]